MKVLHLIDSGGLYGAEKMLLTLVGEQIKQGLAPMILSSGDPGVEEKAIEVEAKRLNLPLTQWRMKPGLNLKGIHQMVSWAKSNGYQLIHSHGYKFNILMGLMPKRLVVGRFVATVHGYTAVKPFSRLGFYQVLDRWMLRRADAVAVVSEELCDQLGRKTSVELIRNGIAANAPISGPTPSGIPDGRYLVAVGRLSAEKAYDRLIDAFDKLGEPGMHLVIIGDGAEGDYLKKMVNQRGLNDWVHFIGYSDNPIPFIQNATALVISSVTEGLPLILLEAMRAGVPVVCTPVGEIPRVLGYGRYGYLSRGCSSADIRDALVTLLSERGTAERKAVAAQREFLENYTATEMAGRYANLYDRLGVA